MTWVDRNQQLIGRLRAYVDCFAEIKPSFFQYFLGGTSHVFPYKTDSEEGFKTLLLYSALQQELHEDWLNRLLVTVYRAFPEKFFSLASIPYDSLKALLDTIPDLSNWRFYSRTPGILRSVCDFFLKQGNIKPLLLNADSTEQVVSIISNEIFYMGKTSVFKTKARTYLWYCANASADISRNCWNKHSLLPVTAGANRLMYYLGPLKSRKGYSFQEQEKINYFNRFYNYLFPDNSWKSHLPFMAFQNQTGLTGYQCQSLLDGCKNCPLCNDCGFE
ncbi:MAG: hypothetical protein HQK83_17990 [Fibrobacteria bacterium]|nr:hypothetical protein [Fibrobacteria bacterium]